MSRNDLTTCEPSWAVAIEVADVMTADRGHIPPETYAKLEAYWSPGQIIEIIAVIGLFNYFNRFAIGLDIPPTK